MLEPNSILCSFFRVPPKGSVFSLYDLTNLKSLVREPVVRYVHTETNAMIKYDVNLDSGTSDRLSEISKFTAQVVDREDSEMSRCVLISPLWRPMEKKYSTVPFCLQSGSFALTEQTEVPGLLFSLI
ncbi:hypothetical protein PO909_022454 [Leuciscus waleckii]